MLLANFNNATSLLWNNAIMNNDGKKLQKAKTK